MCRLSPLECPGMSGVPPRIAPLCDLLPIGGHRERNDSPDILIWSSEKADVLTILPNLAPAIVRST